MPSWRPKGANSADEHPIFKDSVSYQSMNCGPEAVDMGAQKQSLGLCINSAYKKEHRLSIWTGAMSLVSVVVWIIQNEVTNHEGDNCSTTSLVLLSAGTALSMASIGLMWMTYLAMYGIKTIRNEELYFGPSAWTGMGEVGLRRYMLWETLIMLVIPGPWFCGYDVTIPSPYDREANGMTSGDFTNNHYHLTSVIGACMLLLRSYHIVRVLVPASIFHTHGARSMAVAYDCEITLFMMMKQLLNGSLLMMMFVFFYMLMVFSYGAMVFDRVVSSAPPVAGIIGFSDAMWMTLITMTTIGYGNMTPHTYGGRLVMALASLSSLIVFAVIITQVIDELTPSRRESKLTTLLYRMEARSQLKEDSAALITAGMKLLKLKIRQKKHREGHGTPGEEPVKESQIREARTNVRIAAQARKATRADLVQTIDDDIAVTTCEILYEVGYLANHQEALESKVDKLCQGMEALQAGQAQLLQRLSKKLDLEEKEASSRKGAWIMPGESHLNASSS